MPRISQLQLVQLRGQKVSSFSVSWKHLGADNQLLRWTQVKTHFLPKNILSSGFAPGSRKVQMGRLCSLVRVGKTKVFISTAGYFILYTLPHLEIHPIQPNPVLLIFYTTYRLPCPVCGWDLGNCRLCLLALPPVIHQYLTNWLQANIRFLI